MDEPTVTQPSLEGLPSIILDDIFIGNDYKEIANLRLVCGKLKSYVDDSRPDFGLKYIMVNAITSGFLVHFGTNMDDFEKKNYERTVMSVDGEVGMWRPLETVLLHQKSTLEVLQLNCSLEENLGGFGKILEKIETILASQNRQLQVRQFKIHAQNEDQVMKILPYLDPEVLHTIYLENRLQFNMSEANTFMEIQKFKGLDQWKKAKTFIADYLLINAEIEDFDDFDTFRITLDTFKLSDVKKLMEKILTLPMGNSIGINYRNLDADDEVPDGYLPSVRVSDVYDYPIPNDDEKLMSLSLSEDRLRIEIFEKREYEF